MNLLSLLSPFFFPVQILLPGPSLEKADHARRISPIDVFLPDFKTTLLVHGGFKTFCLEKTYETGFRGTPKSIVAHWKNYLHISETGRAIITHLYKPYIFSNSRFILAICP